MNNLLTNAAQGHMYFWYFIQSTGKVLFGLRKSK